MYTRNFRSVLAAVAIATSLGSAPTLYAADDPISLDDGAAPTCSSGTNSVCRTSTESTTTCLEWVGVSLGVWHWAPMMPMLGLPSADPPSAVAGGYCFFGFLGAACVDGWRMFQARDQA